MFPLGYGAEWSVDDDKYLAEISTTSREYADLVMERELAQHNALRLWFFERLEHLVWGWHGDDCKCPMEDHDDPVIRVRATAEAIRRFVDNQTEGTDLDAFEYTQTTDLDWFEKALLDSSCLREELAKQAAIRVHEFSASANRIRELARQTD